MKKTILALIALATLATNATAETTREINEKASRCNLLIRVIGADADAYEAIERYKELGCKEVRGLNCIVDVNSIALGGK